MAVPSTQEITQLLVAWNNGATAALEQLTPLVQAELHLEPGRGVVISRVEPGGGPQ